MEDVMPGGRCGMIEGKWGATGLIGWRLRVFRAAKLLPLLVALACATPCHAFVANIGNATTPVTLPNVKFKYWKEYGGEITTYIRMDVHLLADGTLRDSTGKISGSWGSNYMDLNFNFIYEDKIEALDQACWDKVPVQLHYQGHATVSVSPGGVYTYSGSGMVESQTWTYTYANCPWGYDKVITCYDKPFTVSGSVPRGAKGSPKDNNNTVVEGGNGPARCEKKGGLPNYWINTATLNLFVQDKVCMYPGRGPQLPMTHSYNADPSRIGMFGMGWSFEYQYAITKTADGDAATTATLKKGSGQELAYVGEIYAYDEPPIPFYPPQGNHDKLSWMRDYWLWVEKDTKWTYRFDKAVTDGVTSATEFRLTSITDSNGNQLTLSYTPNNLIQAITDAAGRTTTFTYNSNNRVTRMDTPDGRFATYEYDGRGNLVRSVDLLGTPSTYTYDESGRMTSLSATGKTTQFQYAVMGDVVRVSSVTDANGKTTSYSMSGSTVTKTDPLGNKTTYTNTSNFFTSSVTDPLSNTSVTEYLQGNPVTFTDALGRISTTAYDFDGNVTGVTDATGRTTSYTYDSNDNMTGITDALGKTWTFTYDEKNNLTKIASPLNRQTTMEYDANGQMTGITNAAGKKTAFTHTPHGNLATVTDSLGKQIIYEYDAAGINNTAVTDQRGNKTTFSYDANNRVTGVTNPDGTSRSYAYGCPCAMTSVTDENGNTTTLMRDSVMNLTAVIDPLGNVTDMAYDGNSNLVTVSDALSRDSTKTYDKADRIVRTVNPLSGSTTCSYDANGRLAALADERAKQTKFTYDVNGSLVTSTDPLNAVTQFVRDELGRIKKVITPQSGEILFNFDDDGRLTGKLFGSNTVATFQYDSAGNVLSVVDPLGTTAYAYSARNDLTGITWQDGTAATFARDEAGNLADIHYPGGLSASYQYDSRNRVQQVTWGNATVTFDYDPAGNLVKVTRPNGTVSEFSYDAANRLAVVNHKKGASSFARIQYARDAVGNILSETSTPTAPPTVSTANSPGVFNDTNQVNTFAGDTYTYDLNGNLANMAGSRQMSATYDPENRLLTQALAGSNSTYAYDGMGARASKTQGAATTRYHYDRRGRLLFETDSTGNRIASYCYAGSLLVAMQTADGSLYYYHFDKTGNTVALTDAAGNVANTYQYEPFGKVLARTGTVRNPFTFVGAFGVMDEENGIFYMKNRYYDSLTGKFLQKDPIGFAGGQTNLYAYVGNNPVTGFDPEGLKGVAAETADISSSPYDDAFMATYGEAMENSWSFYAADKATNWVDNKFFGFVYTLPKAYYYIKRGEYSKAAYEGLKFGVGLKRGVTPVLSCALDAAGDVAGSDITRNVFAELLVQFYYTPVERKQRPAEKIRTFRELMRQDGYRFGD